jgi:hypothetical protein
MDLATYYTAQSAITNPGAHIELYNDLPGDIAGLCKVVQGLIIHYRGAEMFNYTIPDERLAEIDTRYVPHMLARIRELDDRPLTEERPPEKRLVGCCRDFSTLFCSMARHRGIPTRTRIGFAAYFNPGFNHDHEIVECWDAKEQRWRLVDPELSELHIRDNRIHFDVHDVPREQFIVGGLAWQWCRADRANPDKFGVEPDSFARGWWFIGHKVIQDLAAQNKMELLLWDTWGIMLNELTGEEDLALLDKLAIITQAGPAGFAEQLATYENVAGLKVTPPVMSYSPVAEPKEVDLTL